jgi:RND family efflux transporter MFP subunit
MNRKRYSLLLLTGMALGILAGCSQNEAATKAEANTEQTPSVEVSVAEAQTRGVERELFATGSLVADESVNVSLEVPGRVQAVHVDFGQSVRKGQVLAELDKREFTWRHERAKASLAQALARIGLKPGQDNQIPETTPAIRQAEAMLNDARFKYENARKLVTSGDISKDRFQEIESLFEARRAATEAARDELNTQLASLVALRAEVNLAEKALSDATARAPFDGAVGERLVSPGQFIRDNQPLMTVVKTWPLRLRVEVPESAVPSVQVGTSLTFTTDAAPDQEFHAVVRQLNPSLEARSRSLTAEARLIEAHPKLKPGMFVQVRLVTEKNADIVVVPKQAIYSIAGLSKVFTIQNGVATEHRIIPGRDLGDWVEVPAEAVRPGDRVATSNLPQLTSGTRVNTRS